MGDFGRLLWVNISR
jgi:hypothetical protein